MAVRVATHQPAQLQRVDPHRSTSRGAPHGGGFSLASTIHHLQRSVGNRAMNALVRSPPIQPKLAVSHPEDESEREADRVADQVMRMPEPRSRLALSHVTPTIQRACHECEDKLQRQPICFGAGRLPTLELVQSTSPIQIQRDPIEMEGTELHPRGLAVEKRVKDVTGRWVNLWQSKKESTIRTLLGDMLAIVNGEIRGLRAAPVVFNPAPSTTEGGFRRQEWEMAINLDISLRRPVSFDAKVSTLSADDLAIIGETFYHEARHAEQAFLVARQRATIVLEPDALAKMLDMPVPVANAAIHAGPPGRDDPGAERIDEWSAFAPSGRYFAYWQWNEAMRKVTADTLNPIVARSPHTADEFKSTAELINWTINILSTKWSFPYTEIADIEKLSAPKVVDTEVLEQLKRIGAAFDHLVLTIDYFRMAATLLDLIKIHPEQTELRLNNAEVKWIDVRIAQLELFNAQMDAYMAYPHEVDARRAETAAKESLLAATKPARAR